MSRAEPCSPYGRVSTVDEVGRTGANGLDADPAQVIADFLLNPQYGVGFPGANLDATTIYGAGGGASL